MAAPQLRSRRPRGNPKPSRDGEGWMSLIGRLVGQLLRKGSITLLTPGKPPQTIGPGGQPHLTVRFTDKKVGFDIAKNPRLGLGEAYMDGRFIVEDGTILDEEAPRSEEHTSE